jgi:hypothetical protein
VTTLRRIYLTPLLVFAAVCGDTGHTGPPICGGAAMAEAQAQVDAALAGNTSCTADSDCVLMQNPCRVVENSCDFEFSAVNLAGEAAVEHAFAVTAAEICGSCTPPPPDAGIVCGSQQPVAVCVAGQCLVPGVPDAGVGSFEWACGFSCGPGRYCDVEPEMTSCPGASGYVLVADGGQCFESSPSPVGGFCEFEFDCGLGLNCVDAGPDQKGGIIGVCSTCSTTTLQPTSCHDGCQLLPDNRGCTVCYCPNGCPEFDGGLPDGGSDDAGADAG